MNAAIRKTPKSLALEILYSHLEDARLWKKSRGWTNGMTDREIGLVDTQLDKLIARTHHLFESRRKSVKKKPRKKYAHSKRR